MMHLEVKNIGVLSVRAEDVAALLDKEGVEFNPISTVNWKEFPYAPEVFFRIAHNGESILLQYVVNEKTSRAKYGEDRGSVWTDSCVEFFSSPADDGYYYNLETNCIGTVLLCCGKNREGREYAPYEVTERILRHSTLGNKPFAEREVGKWSLSLVIPKDIYFKHKFNTLSGMTVRANFYKCGDELQTPHFLSWSPISIENPDFHRPDYFAEIHFQ